MSVFRCDYMPSLVTGTQVHTWHATKPEADQMAAAMAPSCGGRVVVWEWAGEYNEEEA